MVVGMVVADRVVNALRDGVGVAAFSEQAEFSGIKGERGINNEPVEISWECDCGKLVINGRVDATGKRVCWVVFTGNISRVYGESVVGLIKEGVDPAEYSINWFVFAPKVFPSFDDSLVVAVHPKMSARTDKPRDVPDQEFETNSFSPADVSSSFQGLPARNETPGSPFSFDDDADAIEACVREGIRV